MGTSDQVFHAMESRLAKPIRVRTTLYDLVAAIGEEVQSGEEHLIAWTVAHLIKTGQMKFIRYPKGSHSVCS